MTQEHQTLLDSPVLSSLFPLHFKYGYTVTALEFACQHCGRIISMNESRGHITWRTPFVADISTIAQCRCGTLNLQRVRLWDDMCFSTLCDDGEWAIGRADITWKNRLRVKARKFVSRIRERLGTTP